MLTLWRLSGLLLFLNFIYTSNAKDHETNKRTAPFSLIELKNWWNLEAILIDDFAKIVYSMQQNVEILQSAFKIYRNEHDKAANNLELYLSNPLISFALISRLHTDWRRWKTYAEKLLGSVNLLDLSMYKKLPNEIDLELAIDALLNMQRFYRLKPEQLAEGNIGEIKVDAKLSPHNCHLIGQHLLVKGRALKAIEWFQTAIKSYEPQNGALYEIYGFDRANVSYNIAEIYVKMVNYTEANNAISAAVVFSPNNTTFLRYQHFIESNLLVKQTCKAQYNLKPGRRLHCRYNRSTTPFLQLAPFKMEEIHLDPYIVLYHEAIYKNEIEIIKSAAVPHLKLGLVNEKRENLHRTTHYHMLRKNSSLTMERIHRRLVDMTGLDFSDNSLLPISNYGLGGHIVAHFDYINCTIYPDICNRTGDRLATTVFYLSNVTHGGATVFPNIEASILPQQGAAVFWYNLNNAGYGNPKTLHAVCPVIIGPRWMAFKFTFERRNLFTKPCAKI